MVRKTGKGSQPLGAEVMEKEFSGMTKNVLSLERPGGYTGYILGKTRVVHMRFGHFTVCRF